MTTIEELGRRAKQASRQMNRMGTTQKNQILALAAQALVDEQEEILKANAMDIKAAREKNMPEPMVDRLALSESRIAGMAEGLTQLIALEDPIGEIISSSIRPNGLEICKKRVPIGVIGIIYEYRDFKGRQRCHPFQYGHYKSAEKSHCSRGRMRGCYFAGGRYKP